MILQQKFIEIAKKYSDKPAFIDGVTGKEISYSKALIVCLILMEKIQRYKEKNIGIMVPTSGGCMIAIISCLMAGKVPVMINYSTGAIKNSLFARKKCNFNLIITSSGLLQKLELEAIAGMIFIEDFVGDISLYAKVKAAVISKLPTSIIQKMTHCAKEDDNVILLFTSGSEKDPKAVPLTHKNISHQLENIPKILDIIENDIFMSSLPLFHVFGFTTMFWLPIFFGCTIITHANPLEYKLICDSLEKYKVTFMVGTPSFYLSYLKKANKNTFKSLRKMVSGADKLPNQLRLDYLEQHQKEVWEGYGVTEASPVISTNTGKDHRPGSIGKVLPGMQVKIIDIDTDKVLPFENIGKILVKGDSVMNGYYQDIEETSYHMHGGWYDTGDMGMLDKDGYLWHKGRLKRFLKIGGEMVSLVAIEDALEDLFSGTISCCAVELPHQKKGSIIALATTEKVSSKAIKKHLTKKGFSKLYLPRKFFILEELPLMGSGKVNFREVERICRES